MKPILSALFAFLSTIFRSRLSLQLAIVALRHQLTVYQRTTQHPRTKHGDRVLWSWMQDTGRIGRTRCSFYGS